MKNVDLTPLSKNEINAIDRISDDFRQFVPNHKLMNWLNGAIPCIDTIVESINYSDKSIVVAERTGATKADYIIRLKESLYHLMETLTSEME